MCSCMYFKGRSAACLFREQGAHKAAFPQFYRDTIQLNSLAVTDPWSQSEQLQTKQTCAWLWVQSAQEWSLPFPLPSVRKGWVGLCLPHVQSPPCEFYTCAAALSCLKCHLLLSRSDQCPAEPCYLPLNHGATNENVRESLGSSSFPYHRTSGQDSDHLSLDISSSDTYLWSNHSAPFVASREKWPPLAICALLNASFGMR